jgi:hypothetical protein
VELIVLSIGYNLGIFSATLFTILVVTALNHLVHYPGPQCSWNLNNSLGNHRTGSERAPGPALGL